MILSEYFLGQWAQQSPLDQVNKGPENVAVYASLVSATLLISVIRAEAFFFSALKSTEKLFLHMLNAVTRAPLNFFETQSHGRILNRFSKDTAIIDEMIPLTFFDLSQGVFQLIGSTGITELFVTDSSCRCVLSLLYFLPATSLLPVLSIQEKVCEDVAASQKTGGCNTLSNILYNSINARGAHHYSSV